METYSILGKSFDNKKEYLDFIVKNEAFITERKKSAIKLADGFQFMPIPQKKMDASKSVQSDEEVTEILVKLVINSTNILDSHHDVHIDGLWDKSLKESGHKILHLQEHGRSFKDVISRGDDLKAYTETVTWKSLGFDMKGSTQILAFDSLVKKSRNAEMFAEYKDGNVTEHSVGMYYVKMVTCINSDEYPLHKDNWDKYEKTVANREALKETDVFWAILEAKAIEGSAVLMGSNSFTPTITQSKTKVVEENIRDSAVAKWLNL